MFYEKLREACERKGITVSKLLKDLGFSLLRVFYYALHRAA